MSPIEVFLISEGIIGAAAILFYAQEKIPVRRRHPGGMLPHRCVRDKSRPLSKKSSEMEDQEFLSSKISEELKRLAESLLFGNMAEGRIDVAKLVLNAYKEESGEQGESRIFEEFVKRPITIDSYAIFSNSVELRHYRGGTPWELAVISLADGMRLTAESEKQFKYGICKYDSEALFLKTTDDTHDITDKGHIPKKEGHHAFLHVALDEIAGRSDPQHTTICYVLTGPIKERWKGKVEEALDHAEGCGVRTALIYLLRHRERYDNPVGGSYAVLSMDDISRLPACIRNLNRRIMERW